MHHRLDDFFSCLSSSCSPQQTWNETVSFQKSLGFDLVMYGYARGDPNNAGTEVVTRSNFPSAYQEIYRQEHYYRQDPVVKYCITNLPPFLVGRDAIRLWPKNKQSLSAVQSHIIEEAAACGMTTGVAIPLRSPGRHPIAGISLSNAMRVTEFEHFMSEWGHLAHLAALYAHTCMQMQLQQPAKTSSDTGLTSRERECLLWTSRGLSSKEIGTQLNLSNKTVDFHIANAMHKLDAATRSQAVVQAVALGLLEP